MSKTERRKLFQPIPLSSILDPTYQTPFSKLEQFQVDMDITSKLNSRAPQSVWQKLQTSLIKAMSNFVIMSHPYFATSSNSVAALSRSTHSMPLVPWKSWKPCELLLNDEAKSQSTLSGTISETSEEAALRQEKSASLIHSVRSGLQCLRYLATHPLSCEDNEHQPVAQTQTPTRHYFDCRKQNNILLPAVGYSGVGGGPLFFPQISVDSDATCRYSFSAPTSPSHTYYQRVSKPVVQNLFSWAMSGLFFATPLQHRHMNTLYKNYCLFSPVHAKGAEINTNMLCPKISSNGPEKVPSSPRASRTTENNFEIFIHSSSATCQDTRPGNDKPISPTKPISVTNSPSNAGSSRMDSSGCIRIETNWSSMNDEASSSRTNFHSVSVCSTTSAGKPGTLTFSCSSTMASSPRAIMASTRCAGRRAQTESESSNDSFVGISASVESTDSFCIVFESAPGICIDEDIEDDEEEWEDDDDSDDEDEDQVFNYSSSLSDDIFVDGFIFQADGIDPGVVTPGDQVDFTGDSTTRRQKKKTVSRLENFNFFLNNYMFACASCFLHILTCFFSVLCQVSFDDENLENVFEFEDDSESKSCRETYWEMMGRDRDRFRNRVERTGDILEPILQPAHRLNVFQQRFRNLEDGGRLN